MITQTHRNRQESINTQLAILLTRHGVTTEVMVLLILITAWATWLPGITVGATPAVVPDSQGRGWLETTTYLTFEDSSARKAMNAEIQAENDAQTRQKAQKHSNAF